MAKSSNNPQELNPIVEALVKAMGYKDDDYLTKSDLKKTQEALINFLQKQKIASERKDDQLIKLVKEIIKIQQSYVKKKGETGGLTRGTSNLHMSRKFDEAYALSSQGKSNVFDVTSTNKLIQAMKENLSTYEKLLVALEDLQKSIADAAGATGGKLGQSMSNGKKNDKDSVKSGLPALLGKAQGKKDKDIKDATPKGNAFIKGIATLIGFLGNTSGEGFLGKLKKTISEFFAKTGFDALKLAVYGIMSLFRTFMGKDGLRNAIKLALKAIMPGGFMATIGGKVLNKLAGTKAGRAAIKSMAGVAGKMAKQVGGKAASKAVGKAAGKALAGGAGKALAKKIPGLSIAAGLAFGADRLIRDKDWKGAIGEVASGVAGTVPGAGTAVSAAIDVGLIARDVKRASEKATRVSQEGFEGIENQNKKVNEREEKRQGIIEWMKDHWPKWLGGDGGSGSGGKGSPGEYLGTLGAYVDKDYSQGLSSKYQQAYEIKQKGYDETEAEFNKLRKKYKDKKGYKEVWKEAAEKTGFNQYHDYETWKPGDALTSKKGTVLATPDSSQTDIANLDLGVKVTRQLGIPAVALKDLKLNGTIDSQNSIPYIAAANAGRLKRLDDYLSSRGYKFKYTSAMGGSHARGPRSHAAGQKVDVVILNNNGKLKPEDEQWVTANGYIGNGAVGYHDAGSGYHYDLGIGNKSSGKSAGSIPAYNSQETVLTDSRAASEPKGTTPEVKSPEVADSVAVAEDTSTSLEQDLRNAYANTDFDQTGSLQFLTAINSIRVQLGKYQQIGMVV